MAGLSNAANKLTEPKANQTKPNHTEPNEKSLTISARCQLHNRRIERGETPLMAVITNWKLSTHTDTQIPNTHT